MKYAFIGQDIPMLLPTLLTDLLFGADAETEAEIAIREQNPDMAELLRAYAAEILRKSGKRGTVSAAAELEEALRGAACVVYAGDPQAASRFAMDRSALESGNEDDGDDPGLTDQARVNGGIGGLLHAMRAGAAAAELCDAMETACPDALVINLGQPAARTTEVFLRRGFRCFGFGKSPLKGPSGLEAMKEWAGAGKRPVKWEISGLPGFSFLMRLEDAESGKDWLPKLKKLAREGRMGRLSARWLEWWDALPVGQVTDHAEFLPAQPDYIPEERPVFGETVEQRKERILYMNTVRNRGADDTEGAMAQLLLLARVASVRPMRPAVALLHGGDADIPLAAHRNGRSMPQLPPEAVVETALTIRGGQVQPAEFRVPPELAEVMAEIDRANRLAAGAALGDREALREYAETDPALNGLDRLYCREVINRLIRLHGDMLPLWRED